MANFKFLHAADLHIDSPLRGLDTYAGAPIERIRGASRHALTALVDLAIEEAVAFVILVGDIYDGNWADFRTGLFFREQMVRLRRAVVLVFMVRGNHDAESQITRQLPDVEGVKVFSSRRSETVDLPDLGVPLHGKSFPNQAVPEDFVPSYPSPLAGRGSPVDARDRYDLDPILRAAESGDPAVSTCSLIRAHKSMQRPRETGFNRFTLPAGRDTSRP